MSLNADNLTVGYDAKPLVENIKLLVEGGKIVTLIGPNGAGKSTILKSCAGALAPVEGVISFDGNNIYEADRKWLATNVSVMLTKREAPEYVTGFDVVSVGRYRYTNVFGKLSDEDNRIIYDTLETVGARDLADADYDKLSDGQKQRILLARALVSKPRLLILDEPTSFLDIGYKLEFLRLLRELATNENMGILMSLHEVELAGLVSDAIVCINSSNSIDRVGTPKEVLTRAYMTKLFNIEDSKISSKYWDFSYENEEEPCTNEIHKKSALQDNSNGNGDEKKTYFLMIQGTMSNAGKSLITAGLCRIFMQDGYKVAPFKSQNMALNSFVTDDGYEMGRAQVMQAEAAGIRPSIYMNPILLKPTDDVGSQVIVNGKSIGNMKARDYFAYKKSLVPHIMHAIDELKKDYEIIVIEGAGSPAEINLKENDIVNMGMAKMVDAPVLLVGDIDRGGVFAQLFGTVELLDNDEKDRLKGLIINKFRGDKTILDPGITQLAGRCDVPVVGVVPYMNIDVEDEDSLASRLDNKENGLIKIVVIRLPHISNFTDFMVFDEIEGVSVSFVSRTADFGNPDLVIIPGTKSTINDLKWLKSSGFEILIKRYAAKGGAVFGICGGYQMLGMSISDPISVETGGCEKGLELLNIETTLCEEKKLCQSQGEFVNATGIFEGLKGKLYTGYEIHMGDTSLIDSDKLSAQDFTENGTGYSCENIYGTYIHGIFDDAAVCKEIVKSLASVKNIQIDTDSVIDLKEYKEREYDKLADTLRQYLDMDEIYKIMGVK